MRGRACGPIHCSAKKEEQRRAEKRREEKTSGLVPPVLTLVVKVEDVIERWRGVLLHVFAQLTEVLFGDAWHVALLLLLLARLACGQLQAGAWLLLLCFNAHPCAYSVRSSVCVCVRVRACACVCVRMRACACVCVRVLSFFRCDECLLG